MPHTSEPLTDTPIRVTVEMVRNGVIVEGYPKSNGVGGDVLKYTYDSLDEAIKELPAIFSVLKDGKEYTKTERKAEVENLEKEINRNPPRD